MIQGEKRMISRPMHWLGRALRKAGTELMKRGGIQGTWIDVGAHRGEIALYEARHNPGLRVFAVEPNLGAAARLIGAAPNYFVVPVAIAESDGCADFYINEFEAASSLLPLANPARSNGGNEELKVRMTTKVPTFRLDTLMRLLGIETVDFLKIDAQGMDLAVVRSAGERLRDIKKIKLEVWVSPQAQYAGAGRKKEILSFLEGRGFDLAATETQTEGREENLTFVRR